MKNIYYLLIFLFLVIHSSFGQTKSQVLRANTTIQNVSTSVVPTFQKLTISNNQLNRFESNSVLIKTNIKLSPDTSKKIVVTPLEATTLKTKNSLQTSVKLSVKKREAVVKPTFKKMENR